jgi:hypothetical protein
MEMCPWRTATENQGCHAGSYPAPQSTKPNNKGQTMKAKSSSRLISSARCQHFTATGRQCASLAGDRSSGLCPRHAAQSQAASTDAANFRLALTRDAEDFQNAQGVNNSLGTLYCLLSEGIISPRRASVLAYISSLLLRTLPAIDYDNERFPESEEPEVPAQSRAQAAQPAPDSASDPTRQPAPPTSVAPNPVGPGKDPLPKTADEFAKAVLNRKPN